MYSKTEKEGFIRYINYINSDINESSKIISTAGNHVIEQDGFVFRDLEGTGQLLPYEDWRRSNEERAEDLVSRLSEEEMMGLMMHSASQTVPARPGTMMYPATYGGKEWDGSGKPWDLTDQQKKGIEEDTLRSILVSVQQDVETAVRWSNELQKAAEASRHGIPVMLSTDPRHGVAEDDQEFKSEGCGVSKWPDGTAMGATGNSKLCKEYARTAARELRALGIATFLGPQIDLASDPRWMRGDDTFGSNSDLTTEMAKAFCDGLQTTEGSEDGWGKDSVIAMAKHWPGGGSCESGRDAHYAFGKYAVYPGGKLEEHLKPFLEGAMNLDGKTGSCAAIMPYYSISWMQDTKYGENVGNSFSEYIVKDLLQDKYGYDGLICTDWNILEDMTPAVGMYVLGGKPHGVETMPAEERFLKLIMNGVNQFGSVQEKDNIRKACKLGSSRYGSEVIRKKLQTSAYKILLNMFRTGLFDDPYLDLEESLQVLGSPASVEAGYKAQLASSVLLKNKNDVLPLARKKVYVPDRHIRESIGFVRFPTPARDVTPVSRELLEEYFDITDTPEEADAAIVFVDSPFGNGGYNPKDLEAGGNGYEPISLQYRSYTAAKARAESIAGGDPREKDNNRSYKGKTAISANEEDLDTVIEMRRVMQDKPIIVVIRMKHPAVLAELEPYVDAIVADFGVSKKAILDLVSGASRPQGHLPVILPRDMETVELHKEDVADDIIPYTDSMGNVYTHGFGLTYTG